jgi:predicted  nucleic acid-binding Zn-ribbon protein
LRQYADELDTLRRQRNEASWYLGEARANSAALESQVEAITQQLRHHEAELQRWQQDAAAIRKQWEESEWYLGEARSRISHLERHATALEEVAARMESVERERDEATWYLGEERARGEAFEAQLAQLRRHLEDSAARERALQAALDQLKQELSALRPLIRERRYRARAPVAGAHVELRDSSEEPVFAGSPRDVSSTGIGIESDRELPELPSARLRMSLPGCEPIESRAQLKWRRVTEGASPRYQLGYRLLGVSRATRDLIQQVVQQLKGLSGSGST